MLKVKCECGACQKCKAREKSRNHYRRHAERVKAKQKRYAAEKKAAGERYWASTEWKAQYRIKQAMKAGKAPRWGEFALHDAHVEARGAAFCAHVHAWRQARVANSEARKPANAHVRAWQVARPGEWWAHKYRTDPAFNAKEKMRASLRRGSGAAADLGRYLASELKRGRMRQAWEALLGYTASDLARHLGRTMPKGYTWDDFLSGDLHIDHILPRSSFDLTQLGEVRRCWCLSNLRLLPAAENIRKGARVESLL